MTPGPTEDPRFPGPGRATGRPAGVGRGHLGVAMSCWTGVRSHWAITTSWLVCNGNRVAPLAVAALPWERSRGLLGRDRVDGAILLAPAFVVHTFGMRFPIDVAFCDADLRVISVVTMGRNRLSRPRVRARAVVEAQAGAFRGWRLDRGSRLSVEDERES